MLELRGVRHSYDLRVVLDLPQFAVPRGALVAIVGHNGSGKSTLLRLLALLEKPKAGEVRFDGQPVASHGDAHAARRRVTLVEQRPILFRGSVAENMAYGLNIRGLRGEEAKRVIDDIGARLGITGLLSRQRHELSDGEVQRVAVARALALRPDVLLLDEPVSSADRAAAQALYRALEAERAERGLTICFASHQLEDAYRWSDDIRALAEGRLSPVTPENLFRVDLADGETSGTRHASVGGVSIAVMTDKTGPVILAVPPTDIFVSTAPVPSSARNVFPGRVTRIAKPRPGEVHLTAEVGGSVELTAVITEEAARELALTPGAAVVLAFKASAVRVF